MILDEIVAKKKLELTEEKKSISIDGWKERLKGTGLHKTIDFFAALKKGPEISVIAEVKKASPSKGLIREKFDPLDIAGQYYRGGAAAISVLTEKNYFQGSNDYLVKIRQNYPLPILRKDFIIDVWQVYQSRMLGADAILLVASILDDAQLRKFLITAGILGMHCLVEAHDEREIERALEAGAKIIGINNRDLKTFEVDLKTTEKLIGLIPGDRAVVSESGIAAPSDISYLKGLGVDAVLVGEMFMRSENITGLFENIKGGISCSSISG